MTKPTPIRIMQGLNAFQISSALKAALDLNVFTAIGAGVRTAEALAERCETSVKGMRVLCDFLVIHEFLSKESAQYALSPDTAAFLDRNSAGYLGDTARFLLSEEKIRAFENLTAAIRKGGSIIHKAGDTIAKDDPRWAEFARSMMPLMRPSARTIARLLDAPGCGPCKVLDLAAGHGLFGITIAQQNPHAAIYALDWTSVLRIAREHATEAGVVERWNAIEGSAFEVDFGQDYDVILITNFLHHFNPETVDTLLRKVRAALKPGGVAVTLEHIPNDDRVTPRDAASFAIMMLAMTEEGEAYTFAQYDAMLRKAGFERNTLHRPEGERGAVILSRP